MKLFKEFLYQFWYALGFLCGLFLLCFSLYFIVKAGVGMWLLLMAVGFLNVLISGNRMFGGKSGRSKEGPS